MIGDKSVWTCKPVRVARECTGEIITAKELEELLGYNTENTKEPIKPGVMLLAGIAEEISNTNETKGKEADDETKVTKEEKAVMENKTVNGEKNVKGDKSVVKKKNMICPECGKQLVERNGKFGKFMGCSGFPKCRHTEPV